MKSIGAEFFRQDALPGVNHMRGNIIFNFLMTLISVIMMIVYSINTGTM